MAKQLFHRVRCCFLIGFTFLSGFACFASEHVSAGKIELLTLHSKVFSNTRTIRVWLPPGYYEPSQEKTKYPVFYFTDGIATFHGRQLDRIAERLIGAKKIPPTIFVGIDNGGSTLESKAPFTDRADEYLPYPDEFLSPPIPSQRGKQFPEFFEQEVRPLVESRYRTGDAVGLAGASYGAAIAIYTVTERPGKYRWLLLESPSLYIYNDELLHRADAFHDWPQRVYIGAGTKEGKDEDKNEMVDDVKRLEKSLHSRTKTCLTIVPGAEHNEDAWRERLPAALEFLLGSGGCAKLKKPTSSP